MAFTVAAMTAWVLAFGTAPAWQTRAGRLRGFLAQRSAEPSRGTGRRLQVMAAAQMAFAVVVLVSAGLLARSLWQLQSIDRGIETDGVVTTRMVLPSQRYGTPDEVRAFYERAVDAIERLPGVIRSRWRRSPAGWRSWPSWPAGFPPDGRRLPTPRRRSEAANERQAGRSRPPASKPYGQSIRHSVKYSASPQVTRSVPDGMAPSSAGRSGSSVTARLRTGPASSRRRIGVRPKSNDGS